MANPTRNERAQSVEDLAAAARDSSMEKLEGAKAQLAEGADRVADAVERTAENLEGDGGDAVSGFGRSLAGMMRHLAGGLRERDIEQFARELGATARQNPGVFLAGSVALGFGVARFFKAHPPHAQNDAPGDWKDADAQTPAEPIDDDAEESLDLSTSADPDGQSDNGIAPPNSTDDSSSRVPPSGGSDNAFTDGPDSRPLPGGKRS